VHIAARGEGLATEALPRGLYQQKTHDLKSKQLASLQMEEQLFKMEQSAACELGNSNRCLARGISEAQVMVLTPVKAGGAAPEEGTTGSGHSPAAALCWGLLRLHPARGDHLQVSSRHVAHVPGHPLPTDKCMKSHQQIHRVPHTASETKLEG